jgi:hypothetical protein
MFLGVRSAPAGAAPNRGQRGDLVRKVGPQLLDLLGLAVRRLRPLEGGVVLVELSLHPGERRLLLSHCNPHRSQGIARLLQRLVPLQEHGPHHVDHGAAFQSMDALV